MEGGTRPAVHTIAYCLPRAIGLAYNRGIASTNQSKSVVRYAVLPVRYNHAGIIINATMCINSGVWSRVVVQLLTTDVDDTRARPTVEIDSDLI